MVFSTAKRSAENAITFAQYVAPDETNYELKQNSDDAAYFVLHGKNQHKAANRVSGQQWPRHHPGIKDMTH